MAKIIEWQDGFSVKVKMIDDQHKQIIKTTNDLYQAMMDKEIEEKFDEILVRLEDYYNLHFKTEEDLMAKYNFDGIEEHKKAHHAFIEKIKHGRLYLFFKC